LSFKNSPFLFSMCKFAATSAIKSQNYYIIIN